MGLMPSGLEWNGKAEPIEGTLEFNATLSGTIDEGYRGEQKFKIYLIDDDGRGSSTSVEYTIMIHGPPEIKTPEGQITDGEVNAAYSYQFEAEGRGPFTWTALTPLPPGLVLGSDTGVLSGSPTEEGVFDFTIKAVSAGGKETDPKTFTILIHPELLITSGDLPDSEEEKGYSFQFTASGGVPEYRWHHIGGTLPTGLNLTLDGVLSGIPEQRGVYTFTIALLDELGVMKTRQYTVEIYKLKEDKKLCGMLGVEVLLLLVILHLLKKRSRRVRL
jgi:hypothetical protein